MHTLHNPLRHQGLADEHILPGTAVSVEANKVLMLLQHCPAARITPLHDPREMATQLGIDRLFIKDERERMGLGSFKAAGAAYVIASAAAAVIEADPALELATITPQQLSQCLTEHTYICASAGNHGLSVAAGAKVFGANAVIYLSHSVPPSFVDRLQAYGAEVVIAGDDYTASLHAAMTRQQIEGWTLLADTSWEGYTELPTQVMEGYLVVPAEICQQFSAADEAQPTHIFLQAGVGGIAAAATAYLRHHWGDEPTIIVAEPDAAPALLASVEAGHSVETEGPASDMGRLDCKEPSQVALQCLAKEVDWFVTLSDTQVLATVDWLAEQGFATTSSAAAGLAVVQQSQAGDAVREQLGLDEHSRVLVILTEQA